MIKITNNNTYRQNINIVKTDTSLSSRQNEEASSSEKNNKIDQNVDLQAKNKNSSIDDINKKLSEVFKSADLSNEKYEEMDNSDFIAKTIREILKRFEVTQKISTGEKLTNEEQEFRNTRGIIVPGAFMTKKKNYSETYLNSFNEGNYSNNLDIKK
ncbi:hypothetical protein [Paraclostridium bifermentans]|uniref:hypothetical protein n=1 Tax=Paraclostridium bifermentans TaxID=1490 RepID=UPI0011588B90|nr:hypothetical protein [Paraclostridium bifermentans]TQO55688.1 hypothetical protein D5S05_16970 [Paraclostridium bifermentans]